MGEGRAILHGTNHGDTILFPDGERPIAEGWPFCKTRTYRYANHTRDKCTQVGLYLLKIYIYKPQIFTARFLLPQQNQCIHLDSELQ